MPRTSLSGILQFTELLNAFQGIERTIYIPKNNDKENDIEHSYHLAMLAWYIAEHDSLNVNKELVLKYALIHDLVEVYAGDTFLFSKNQHDHDSKHDREEAARLRILSEFPHFEDLHTTILNYENRIDNESRFVYVLDKIHPVLQNYLDKGRLWKDGGITLAMVLEKKKDKMHLSPELIPYWDELEKILVEEESALFFKQK